MTSQASAEERTLEESNLISSCITTQTHRFELESRVELKDFCCCYVQICSKFSA